MLFVVRQYFTKTIHTLTSTGGSDITGNNAGGLGNTENQSSSVLIAAVVGGCVAGFLLLSIILMVVLVLVRRRRRRRTRKDEGGQSGEHKICLRMVSRSCDQEPINMNL